MNRVDLLDKLAIVAPALSSSDLIPVMTHLWFSGHDVMAFNDQIALSTKCKTDFSGAIAGKTLLGLLRAMHTKEIEFIADDDNLTIKSGNTKLKLGLMPPESFIFQMPNKGVVKTLLPVDPTRFLEAIETCMRSVSNDSRIAEQSGITLIVEGTQLLVFATNNSTMSHDRMRLRGEPGFQRVILSSQFCKEILRLSDGVGTLSLEILDGCAMFKTPDATLFGRLIDTSHPLPYQDMLKNLFPDKARGNLSPIYHGWRLVLERACILSDDDVYIKVITDPKGIRRTRVYYKSAQGEGFESLQTDTKQPEVTLKIEPKLLKAVSGVFDQMLLTNQAAIMVKASKIYMVSATDA